MSQNINQPSFAGGELSPQLYGRVDTAKYRQGCRKLRNFFVHPGGGASNRAGTEFVGEVGDSSYRWRLIPFQFNGQVTYVLAFGDKVMRVIRDGGIVLGNFNERLNNGDFALTINNWSITVATSCTVTWDNGAGGRMKFVTTHGAAPNPRSAIAEQIMSNLVVGATYTITCVVDAGDDLAMEVIDPVTAQILATATLPGNNTYVNSFIATQTTATIRIKLGDGPLTAYLKSASVFGPDGSLVNLPFELPTPWAYQDLPLLKYTQSADVITFTHPKYPPQDIGRLGDASWTLTPISFVPQVAPPAGVTATFTAGSNIYRYRVTALNAAETEESLPGLWTAMAITITGISNANPAVVTVANTFSAGDEIQIDAVVGMTQLNGRRYLVANPTSALFELRNYDNTNVDSTAYGTYGSGGTCTPTFVRTSAAVPTLAAPIKLTWISQAGASKYNIYRETNGIFGQIGSAVGNAFSDTNIAPDASTSPPGGRDPFAGGNYPSTVAYHEQRKFFANSLKQPQTLWATQTGNFKNMNVSSPTKDDDAITRTLVASQVNAIKHMVSMNVLILFTSGAEWKCFPGTNNDAITPANCYTRPQSYNGCSDVPPIVANNSILFVQEKGSVIRDVAYEFASDSWTGNDRSVWSDHLFKRRKIVEWAYAQEPFRIIWAVCDDGALLGFTYMKEQEIYAWHRHDTDGVFESVAVISEDDEDVAYFIVRRTINGTDRRYIERLHSRSFNGVADAWFLDCALEYRGAATNTISGLTHLEGKTVNILGDGNVFPAAVVTGGAIQIDNPASQIIIGLPYSAELETLDLDIGDPTIQGKRKKISAVTVKLQDSRGLKIGGTLESGGYTHLTEVKERTTQLYGTPIGLLTGQERVLLDPIWNSNGRILIRQDNPLPCTILAAIPEVDLGS